MFHLVFNSLIDGAYCDRGQHALIPSVQSRAQSTPHPATSFASKNGGLGNGLWLVVPEAVKTLSRRKVRKS